MVEMVHNTNLVPALDTEVLGIWNPDNLKQGGIQF